MLREGCTVLPSLYFFGGSIQSRSYLSSLIYTQNLLITPIANNANLLIMRQASRSFDVRVRWSTGITEVTELHLVWSSRPLCTFPSRVISFPNRGAGNVMDNRNHLCRTYCILHFVWWRPLLINTITRVSSSGMTWEIIVIPNPFGYSIGVEGESEQ